MYHCVAQQRYEKYRQKWLLIKDTTIVVTDETPMRSESVMCRGVEKIKQKKTAKESLKTHPPRCARGEQIRVVLWSTRAARCMSILMCFRGKGSPIRSRARSNNRSSYTLEPYGRYVKFGEFRIYATFG